MVFHISTVHKTILFFGTVISALVAESVFAQTSKIPENDGAPLKVIFGLLAVLGTIAFLAWLMKKLSHTKLGQFSVARIVGGVSVGSRERVVVVEVGGRWIVVGVANGSVNGIANLEIPHQTEGQHSPEKSPESLSDLEANLTKYEYRSEGETQALANPALTSLIQKFIKK
jgi:flagellar biosynthetic protein FliO